MNKQKTPKIIRTDIIELEIKNHRKDFTEARDRFQNGSTAILKKSAFDDLAENLRFLVENLERYSRTNLNRSRFLKKTYSWVSKQLKGVIYDLYREFSNKRFSQEPKESDQRTEESIIESIEAINSFQQRLFEIADRMK